MVKITVCIPSRNEKFLNKTIKDVLDKACGEIEVIAVLDGYDIPDKIDDPKVQYIVLPEAKGMRNGINVAVDKSKGDYILKTDAHCMFDNCFDEKLIADCEDNWVVIPRRHRLDANNWCLEPTTKPPIDYEYLSYPNNPGDFGGAGLHGRKWNQRTVERMNIPLYMIDENMSFQGSCWFMKKKYFYQLELMDDTNYGPFWQEAQEIGLKAWTSGGKVMVNKKTWYAHLHKGSKYGRGYQLEEKWLKQGVDYTNKWLTDSAWDKQTKPFTWVIEHFWPVPEWPEDRSLWLKPA